MQNATFTKCLANKQRNERFNMIRPVQSCQTVLTCLFALASANIHWQSCIAQKRKEKKKYQTNKRLKKMQPATDQPHSSRVPPFTVPFLMYRSVLRRPRSCFRSMLLAIGQPTGLQWVRQKGEKGVVKWINGRYDAIVLAANGIKNLDASRNGHVG